MSIARAGTTNFRKWFERGDGQRGTPPIEKGMFTSSLRTLQERGIPSLSTEEGRTRIEDHIRDAQTIYFDNISTLFRAETSALARIGRKRRNGFSNSDAWNLVRARSHDGKG